MNDVISLDEITSMLDGFIDGEELPQGGEMMQMLICYAGELKIEPLHEKCLAAFDSGMLADEFRLIDRKHYIELMSVNKTPEELKTVYKREIYKRYWDDTSEEMKEWSMFDGKDDYKDDEPPREERIGRNDPCPCGSGKKYKKCCGK